MSEAIDSRPFPKGALLAAAFLVGTTMLFASTARLTDWGATRLSLTPITAQRDLVFADRADGAIGISDAATGRQVAVLQPGESGFVRVVLRGMAHDRLTRGGAAEAAFELRRHADGIVSIRDTQTGRIVTLSAFGDQNAAAFTNLIDRVEHGSTTP